MSALLQLKNLGCVRGGRLIFSGVDLTLGPNDAALVTGPNGAGKSSLLRLVAGLLPPFTGAIEAEGRIALAGEALALDRGRPLVRAVRYWARLDGAKRGAVGEALEAMDLATLSEVPVRMLSTGQGKRAALARVIASGAPIWLLDEPLNGLDTQSRSRLEAAIARHRQAGGIVVAASHQSIVMPGATALALGNTEA